MASKSKKFRKLNHQQVLFCKQYIINMDAMDAYVKAGYKADSANPNAYRMLDKPHVAEYIDRLLTRRCERLQITADDVLVRLDKMSRANPKQLFDENGKPVPVQHWPEELAQAVSSVKFSRSVNHDDEPIEMVDVKFVDKKGTTELLAKHLKLLGDQVDVNITDMRQVDEGMSLEDATKLYAENLKAFNG